MTKTDRDKLRELQRKATLASWECGVVRGDSVQSVVNALSRSALVSGGSDLHGVFIADQEIVVAHTGNGPTSEANAAFIAAACNACWTLLDDVERLEAENARLRPGLEALRGYPGVRTDSADRWDMGFNRCAELIREIARKALEEVENP